MSTHIDTLAEWFDSGETGTFTPGDVIISKNDDEYVITTINHSGTINPGEPDRILHRAPKPKPAWHNAVAVIAQTPGRDDRRVFIRDTDGWWADVDNSYETDELAHASPLIEQKVTDEMVARLDKSYADHADALLPFGLAQTLLAAALGLDPA